MANRWENKGTSERLYSLGLQIIADGDCSHEIKRLFLLGRKAVTNSVFKCRDITLPAKVHIVKTMVFLVVMYRCESWTIKKTEHRRSDAFELWYWRRLKNSLDGKEIKPASPKGNQPWMLTERTDAASEAPILWPPDMKNRLIGKAPDAG